MVKKPRKMSSTQLDVIKQLEKFPGAKLVRIPGGYWTVNGTTCDAITGAPSWRVGYGTIASLTSKKLLVRTHEKHDIRDDPRMLAC